MRSNRWPLATSIMAACSLVSLSGLAGAASYCADDTAELVFNLASAAQSPEDDVIRVRSGTFTPGSDIDLVFNGAITISGGWGIACLGQSANPESTTITNAVPGQFNVVLRPRADLSIDRMTFNRINRLIIQDLGDSPSAVGTIRLSRSRFIINDWGPLFRPRDSNLRVENNLITGSLQRALAVDRSVATAPFTALIHHNTIAAGVDNSVEIGGTPGTVRLRNNIVVGGAGDGVLRIVDGVVTVNHNRLGSITFVSGGSASPAFDNLLSVDPQLNAGFVPLAGSPMLNSGTNSIEGGLPATDYVGNPRKIGSRPDRGARESAISDTTTINVTSAANSGAGSLRQAILDANFTPGEETIAFSITGACPRIIILATPLPTITSTTTIDGFTQQGASANTHAADDPDGDNSVHCIGLFGDGASIFNLQPAASQEITIRGLALYRATGAQIAVSGAGKAAIIGNTFNTGLTVFEPAVPEYAITVDGANSTRIGGTDRADRNIIGRASVAGIRIGEGDFREIESNWIGIGKSGLSVVPNAIGITISDGAFTSIDGNAIGHNQSHGIRIEGALSSGNIQRNKIGLSPISAMAGQAPNGGNGIRLAAGDGFFIRVNQIRNNGTDGLVVLSAVKNADFLGNEIIGNEGLGIDMSPDGVNPIDTDTGATGANNGQNFPELFAASGSAQQGQISGRLRSANGSFSVTFYRSSNCDGSGFGEGREMIGGTVVTIANGTAATDGAANFTATVTTDGNLAGDEITAIATRKGPSRGSSSEFSACIPYVIENLFTNGFEP